MEGAGLAGLVDCLVEIAEPCEREQALGHVVLNPCGGAQRCAGIALQVALLYSLRIAHHFPAITCQISAVNDEHAHSAAACGFFIFVGPATVVGEGFAREEFLVVRGRLIDDDQSDFALEVNLFAVCVGVVVPAVFGRMNSVANKNDWRIDVRHRLAGLVFGDDVGAINEIDGLALHRHEEESRLVLDGVNSDKWYALEIGAVVTCGLDAGKSKLSGDVFGCEFAAASSGAPAFEQVKRKKANMGANIF